MRTHLLKNDCSSLSHFHELGLDFRDRLKDGLHSRPKTNELGGSLGVLVRSAYLGALSRRSAFAAPGSQPGVPSPLSVSHALEGLVLNVRAALFHAADALRFLPSKPSSSSPTLPHSSRGEPFSTFLVTRCYQPAPPRPQGFLSDRKPYPRTTVFHVASGPVLPWSFLRPNRRVCTPWSNRMAFLDEQVHRKVGRGAILATASHLLTAPRLLAKEERQSEAPRCGEAIALRSIQSAGRWGAEATCLSSRCSVPRSSRRRRSGVLGCHSPLGVQAPSGSFVILSSRLPYGTRRPLPRT